METEERKGKREFWGGRETLKISIFKKGENKEEWRRWWKIRRRYWRVGQKMALGKQVASQKIMCRLKLKSWDANSAVSCAKDLWRFVSWRLRGSYLAHSCLAGITFHYWNESISFIPMWDCCWNGLVIVVVIYCLPIKRYDNEHSYMPAQGFHQLVYLCTSFWTLVEGLEFLTNVYS